MRSSRLSVGALLDDLNPEQAAAVSAPDGPVLVIAAAGTGKTRTLTYRVAHLVGRGISPGRILLLTFTNQAAREMLERARRLAGDAVSGVWGGTFHHFANRILRRYAHLLGYASDYSILDRDDSLTLLRECVRDLEIPPKRLPRPEVLVSFFSTSRNRGDKLPEAAAARFNPKVVSVDELCRVYEEYTRRKIRINAMDFDDLIINALALLEKHPAVLQRYQEQFEHILVDEYQDTNPLQARLVDLLAARRRNLLVVGDDFQSIYGWRGAEFRNILDFPRRYPDCRRYMLETNYRSTPEILQVANVCIAGNPEQFQKTLRAVNPSIGRPPVVARLVDGRQQAEYVIDLVRQLGAEGIPPREIAVLYRAHYHAMELQLELFQRGIPYVITSGVRFFEQVHVKDVCSIVRLVHNPRDFVAFRRLLKLFSGVGDRTAQKIWTRLGERAALLDPHTQEEIGSLLPSAAREDWKALCRALAECREPERPPQPAPLLEAFVSSFYGDLAQRIFEDIERRLEDINEVIRFAGGFPTVEAFVTQSGLLTNLDAEPDNPAYGKASEALRLSTVHQAKGLEWTAVIVLWMVEGMFPSARALAEQGEAEERRLFYVAVTRARTHLYLCLPTWRRERRGVTYCEPSRFLKELPPDSVTLEDLVRADW